MAFGVVVANATGGLMACAAITGLNGYSADAVNVDGGIAGVRDATDVLHVNHLRGM